MHTYFPSQISNAAVAVAMGMVVASGLCTVLGGMLVFCVSATNHKFLSVSLGLAAGVMVVSMCHPNAI